MHEQCQGVIVQGKIHPWSRIRNSLLKGCDRGLRLELCRLAMCCGRYGLLVSTCHDQQTHAD